MSQSFWAVEKGDEVVVWLPESREIHGHVMEQHAFGIVVEVVNEQGTSIRWRIPYASIVASASVHAALPRLDLP